MMKLSQIEEQLFFIIGCPRSGTSLLKSLLASHPDMTLPHETGFYTRIYSRFSQSFGEILNSQSFEQALVATLNDYRIKELNLDIDTLRFVAQNEPKTWETIFLSILATYAQQHHATRIGEKSPRHFQSLGILQERFPHAKFIHVIRDPRATVLSLIKAPFGSNRISWACQSWHSAIETHRQWENQLGSQRYKLVKYETLVNEVEETLREISNFLDIEFSPEMLNFHQRQELGFNSRYTTHMSNTFKPVFTSSINKWKDELNSSQVAIIQTILKDDMKLMNYQPVKAQAILPQMQYQLDCLSRSLEHRYFKVEQVIKNTFFKVKRKKI